MYRATKLSCFLDIKSIFSPFLPIDIYYLCLILWVFTLYFRGMYVYRHIGTPLCRLGKMETEKVNRLSALPVVYFFTQEDFKYFILLILILK